MYLGGGELGSGSPSATCSRTGPETWIRERPIQFNLNLARSGQAISRTAINYAIAGSCRGAYHVLVQPGSALHRTVRWPGPFGCLATAGGQSHGDHDTMTRPGPQACPAWHRTGKHHHSGRTAGCSPMRSY